MNTEDLVKKILEAFATAQGVRKAAKNRPSWEEDEAIEAQDKRKEMEDSGETVRVSTDGDAAKVTRKVSDRVRDRRAAEGKPHGSKGNPMFRTRVVSSTELVRGARAALAERVLGEMYGGVVSSIKDPVKKDDAEFEFGRMNKKAKRSLNKKRISKKATAQAQKTIQGTDPNEPTLSGGSRPWNK